MRYRFGRWNIEICKVQMHLSFDELYLLEYLQDYYKSNNSTTMYIEEEKYVWFQYDTLLQDSRLFIINEESDLCDDKKKSLTRDSQLNKLSEMMLNLEKKGIIYRSNQKIKKDRESISSYGTKIFIYMNVDVLNIMQDKECTTMTEEQHKILSDARIHTPHQNDAVAVHQNDAVNTYNKDTDNINTKKNITDFALFEDSRNAKDNSLLVNNKEHSENNKDGKIVRINFRPEETMQQPEDILRAFIIRSYKKMPFYISEYEDKDSVLQQHENYIVGKYTDKTIYLAFTQMLEEINNKELNTINTKYINTRLDKHDVQYQVDVDDHYETVKGKKVVNGIEVECPKCGEVHRSKVPYCTSCYAQFVYQEAVAV